MERMLPQNHNVHYIILNLLYKEENRSLFINWMAGLAGGLSAITLFSPFDLARTRHILLATTNSHGVVQYKGFLHTLAKIYTDEGFRGLYKGYGAAAVTIPIFHSLYFAIFYRTKDYLNNERIYNNRPVVRDMLASLYTGVVCNTLTNPLWVVRTRIQSQFLHREDAAPKYVGLMSGLRNLVKEEGYKSLFKGMLASYLGLSHCVILYPLYEQLKSKLSDKNGQLTNFDILVASNISKVVAMTITYPHIVIRARLQDHRTPKKSFLNQKLNKYGNTITSVIKNTYTKEGLKGLYSGLKIDLIRVLPANSITFLVFEYVKRRFEEALSCDKKM